MAEPVLVVHGVANRDRNVFEAEVRDLAQRVGASYRLIPVFWGDLGAATESVLDTLPSMPGAVTRSGVEEVDPALITAVLGQSDSTDAVRGGEDQEALIVQGAATNLDNSSGTRSTDATESVREAVQATLPTTRYLQHIHDPATLDAIGRAVGSAVQPIQQSGDYALGDTSDVRGLDRSGDVRGFDETRGFSNSMKNIAQNVLMQIDNVVGTAVGTALGRANQHLRRAFGVQLVSFIGDVFVYQRESAKIQQRLWQAINEHAPEYGTQQRPINVVAHSLGGVVTFDTAIRGEPPLWINGFVTFGSQPAFFHVIDPRLPELMAYAEHTPVALPPRIGRWTNLWEPMDPLAFGVGTIFRLATGQKPKDIYVDNPAHALVDARGSTHGTYWRSEELVQAIRETIVS